MKRIILMSFFALLGAGLVLAAFCNEAKAAPAQVCLKDGKGVKCLNVQQGASAAVNTARVNALLRQAAKLSKQIREMLDAGNGKAGDVAADVINLKEKVRDLEAAIRQLATDAKTGRVDSARALKRLADLERAMGLLGHELSAHRHALRYLIKNVRHLEKRRINLEIGGFGAGAYKYGGEAGALVSLALPMGESGLWTARLSGGLGVSPSMGLSWLAMGTLSRTLAKGRLELGPAILGMGDEGGLIQGRKNWLFGAGAELRLHLAPQVHLSVAPFMGVTPCTELQGRDWQDAVYAATGGNPACACSGGRVLVKEGGFTRWEEARTLKFTGGVLGSLSFPLF